MQKSDLENGDKNVDTRNDDTSKRGHEVISQLYILFAKYCESHGFYSITYILFIYLVRFLGLLFSPYDRPISLRPSTLIIKDRPV